VGFLQINQSERRRYCLVITISYQRNAIIAGFHVPAMVTDYEHFRPSHRGWGYMQWKNEIAKECRRILTERAQAPVKERACLLNSSSMKRIEYDRPN
jgi:hypothetical protein